MAITSPTAYRWAVTHRRDLYKAKVSLDMLEETTTSAAVQRIVTRLTKDIEDYEKANA